MLQYKDMQQLIDVASRVFDLGKWSDVTRLKGGILNEVYRLETSSGKYVMKVNRVRQSKIALAARGKIRISRVYVLFERWC